MNEFFREPLVHFLGLGAVIFGLFLWVGDSPSAPPENIIEVTDTIVSRLDTQFEATWRRPPNEEERTRLVEAYVREEVLVREALALGLDRGDEIVRQRMAQKILFLAEGGAEAVPVTEAALQAHLAAHSDRFERPASVTFSHILLRDDVSDDEIAQALADDAKLDNLTRPSILPTRMDASPAVAVDGTFGSGMFAAIFDMPPGQWSGPVESAFGRHMVYLQAKTAAHVPALAEIEERVEMDWRASLREARVAERIEALLAQYEVVRTDNAAAAR